MSKEVAVLATVAAGGVVALQAPANNVLSKHLGSFGAAVASFSVGLIVTVSLIAVRELGAGGVTAATIAGQLALSVVIDRMGVLGLDERAITWEKLLGIGLLALGTVLIVRE